MMKTCNTLFLAFLLMALAAVTQANATGEIGSEITAVGVVVVMDDGFYLDDGSRLYLLVEMEDPQYEGFTIEVTGQFVMIDDQPAIKVSEMSVLEKRPANDESQESDDAPARKD